MAVYYRNMCLYMFSFNFMYEMYMNIVCFVYMLGVGGRGVRGRSLRGGGLSSVAASH